MNMKNISILAVLAALTVSLVAFSHGDDKHEASENPLFSGLDADAAQVVKQFHTALRNSDTELAKSVLSDDVLIYESGTAERSSEEYAAGHMKADMQYLATISSEIIEHQVKVSGDLAISTARFKNLRTVAGRNRESISMETIVVSKIDGKWFITHIHWS